MREVTTCFLARTEQRALKQAGTGALRKLQMSTLKASAVSVAIAILVSLPLSYYLDLSSKAAQALIFICIVLSIALGVVIRFIWSRLHTKK